MSKGLEALERLVDGNLNEVNYYRQFANATIEIMKDKETIEKELKRLEEIDNGAHVPVHINRYNELCDKEKALEIIKSKEINIHSLLLHLKRFDSPDGYNALVGAKYQITQEEWDFLKGVML